MIINFFVNRCKDQTNRKLFGLCDDRPNQRAYLDENDGTKWIAVVVNESLFNVIFTAIDNCIETKRSDGKMDKRCDGFLVYESTIIFVELKEIGGFSSNWVQDGEQQIRSSLKYFEITSEAENYSIKKAYIANNEHPKARTSQAVRMDRFLNETGYILRIENRIILE